MKKKLDCGCNGKYCRLPEHFIGSVLPTPKAGILTVIGISDRNDKDRYYIISCSVCSLDSELFPNGFEMSKGDLIRGRIPCGCSKQVGWTKAQYEIRVKRECIKRGYIFHSFVGEWKKALTSLKMECLLDGNIWNVQMSNFFSKTTGCKTCALAVLADKKRVPKKQREGRLRGICESECSTFVDWKDGYINGYSKFNWICSNGHFCCTASKNFESGSRCYYCAREAKDWNFYPERANDPDTLYLLKFIGTGLAGLLEIFIKIGRTFNLKRRLIEFRKTGYDIEVLATEVMTHQEVYDTEQVYHKIGKEYHYTPLVDFGGSVRECFTVDIMDIITLT